MYLPSLKKCPKCGKRMFYKTTDDVFYECTSCGYSASVKEFKKKNVWMLTHFDQVNRYFTLESEVFEEQENICRILVDYDFLYKWYCNKGGYDYFYCDFDNWINDYFITDTDGLYGDALKANAVSAMERFDDEHMF